MKRLHYKDPVTEEQALAALAAYPDDEDAKACLESQDIKVSALMLANKRVSSATKIEEIRKQIAPKLEGQLTGDLLDEARHATVVIEMAIKRTEERLEKNMIVDPSRVARDLSQLRTQAIDKRLALEGRPTSITESRSADEMIRALESMGVARQVTIESTAEELT